MTQYVTYDSTAPRWAYDMHRDKDSAIAQAAKLGQNYTVAAMDEFTELSNAYNMARLPLSEVTEEFHDDQLNILPPVYRTGAMGFFMSEFLSGSITAQFVQHRGKYYAAYVDILRRDSWITPEKIDALPPAAPLERYKNS